MDAVRAEVAVSGRGCFSRSSKVSSHDRPRQGYHMTSPILLSDLFHSSMEMALPQLCD